MDVTKIFTERMIDVISLNVRTSKNNTATLEISFEVANKEEMTKVIDKVRQVEGIIDIERTRS